DRFAGPIPDPVITMMAPCATPPLGRGWTFPLAAFTTAVIEGAWASAAAAVAAKMQHMRISLMRASFVKFSGSDQYMPEWAPRKPYLSARRSRPLAPGHSLLARSR